MKGLLKEKISTGNRDSILSWLESGGNESEIQLSDKQNDLLERWRYADELLRLRKLKKYEIAEKIKSKFGVSQDTANSDIVNAQFVFASLTPINKKYEIGVRIEFIKAQIEIAAISKDFKSVAMMEKILQDYYKDYPDEIPQRAPSKIIFMFNQQNVFNTSISADDAIAEADALLEERILEHE